MRSNTKLPELLEFTNAIDDTTAALSQRNFKKFDGKYIYNIILSNCFIRSSKLVQKEEFLIFLKPNFLLSSKIGYF